MSYSIARVEKYSSGSVSGIQIHDQREKDGTSHTNKEIDWSRTHLNFDLHNEEPIKFHRVIKERIESLDLKKAVRKDAIVMAQVFVGSDNDFFKNLSDDKAKEFFKDTYYFFKEKYGSENIISASVHLDETTPHMHINFVPVTPDGRLCAKDVIGYKTELSKLQDEFNEFCKSKGYDLLRGEKRDKPTRHLTVHEFKKKTIKELDKTISEKKVQSENLDNSINTKSHDLELLELKRKQLEKELAEAEKLKADINALKIEKQSIESQFKVLVMDRDKINRIQPEKTLTGAIKGITLEDIDNLKKTALGFNQLKSDLYSANLRIQNLEQRIFNQDNSYREQIKDLKKYKGHFDYITKVVYSDEKLKSDFFNQCKVIDELEKEQTKYIPKGRSR